MSDFNSLALSVADGVAELTLIGPGKGNAMGPDFWREMPIALAALEADASVRVIVLRGSGEHFSYGLDLIAMLPELGQYFAGTQLARAAHPFARQLLAPPQDLTAALPFTVLDVALHLGGAGIVHRARAEWLPAARGRQRCGVAPRTAADGERARAA